MKKNLKYGSFLIDDSIATWNRDKEVKFNIVSSPSEYCLYEGVWNDVDSNNISSSAIAGVCIWNKYDCLFTFESICKGNTGAIRSLGSPREKEDLVKRLDAGQKVEKIVISLNPFGEYQTKTISWQSDVVKRFDIKNLHYVVPFLEYKRTLESISDFFSKNVMHKLYEVLDFHHKEIKRYVLDNINTNVEFIYPLLSNPELSIEESYTWPYENLEVDMGIEEMEEIRIPYQVKMSGKKIPRILLGILDDPCPYNKKRKESNIDQQFCIHLN